VDELRADDPRQVGGYTLLAPLGSGGMGDVYLGRSLGGRHVAVKVIRADLAQDQSFRARFAREVAAARRVSGAFTAPVIDADPDAPVPWLVTDYVPGPSLGEAVARYGALPPSAVLILAARLAEGLVAVHAAGVIHRDLKPANVLLAEDGPRLIDFGISQAADFAQITSPTSVLGTPGFIAPELIQGGPVGPASDVFTMAAVIAYAATGELPFGTGPADARTLRVLYLAPDLEKVPAGLRPLLERCLAKDPAERPTASEFLADLVAACPEAAEDRDDWLPANILAETRPLGSEFPPREAETPLPAEGTAASGVGSRRPQAAEVLPAVPRATSPADDPPGKRRRRAWVVCAAAALAVLGTVTGVLAASSGPSVPSASGPVGADPPGPPTNLMPVTQAVSSIAISWQGNVSGPAADSFEILKDGGEVTTVPGDTVKYEVTGLSPGTAYRFSVIAIAGDSRSAPSSTLTVSTYASSPSQVAKAPLNWDNNFISTRETASSDSYFKPVGATWEDIWTLSSNCLTKPCDSIIDGSVDDWSFNGNLSRDGAVYSGSTTVDGDWGCGGVVTGTLHITLTGKTAGIPFPDTELTITSFTGTMTLDVPARPGCAASTYQMQVSSEPMRW
jgi:serine/threonine protein kinase